MRPIKYLHNRHHPRVKALEMFSRLCAENNLSPAQGLRIIRRTRPNAWRQFCTTPDPSLLPQLRQLLLDRLKPEATTWPHPHLAQPDHFLLTTNLPTLHQLQHGTRDVPADIHFLRTQRRYNKRRYARVRATSRPSFWAGMMLSATVTGAFWGATIQMLDWGTTEPIILDANVILWLLYIIVGMRIFRLYLANQKPRHREGNKSKRGWIYMLKRLGGRYIRW